ncbi:MAG: NAD(P)-dependent dehydrogenase (short-subunit alcohol dehydrogenase family) [Paracoccaceae bacterium]|jgi:NAD(P)-dependent dehydrogenase (short-subunit alcohol dehydrogenase family)
MTRDTLNLEGRVAMITGGARGMGREHALLMAERGADIIVNDLDPDTAAATAEECRALGRKATVMACDNTDIKRFVALIGEHEAEHGRVDILVNNAGIQGNKLTIEEIDEDIWHAMTNIKMKASFFAVRALVPGMKARKYGKIINTSSIFAMEGSFSMSHYTGAASGVLGYVKGWARELAPWNICVNAVAPGTVATELTINSMGWDVIKDFEKTVPMGRLADKKEIAYAVAWLASPETDFLTGQLISPNGGQTIVGI